MGNLKDLKGKICLIAGGAGTVGEGVVKAFLKQEATVIVPSRSPERLDRLRAFVGPLLSERLELLLGDLGEPQGAERLREQILARWGVVHAVVASLGGSWEERLPLLKVPMATFRTYQDNNFNAHLITAQTFLPVLMQHAGSSYTLLGGLSALLAEADSRVSLLRGGARVGGEPACRAAPSLRTVGSCRPVARVARIPRPGETVLSEGYDVVPGGKGANQALAARRLGAEVSLSARVGRDGNADAALNLLRAAGVDLSSLREDDKAATGVEVRVVVGLNETSVACTATGKGGMQFAE